MKKNIFTLWNTTYLKQHCNNKTTTIRDAFSKRFTNITRYTTCTTNTINNNRFTTNAAHYITVVQVGYQTQQKQLFNKSMGADRLIFKLTQLYTSTQYQHYNTNVETG